MTYPIRVIMPDGTVHTLRNSTTLVAASRYPGAARIERMDVKQPPPLIEGDNDT